MQGKDVIKQMKQVAEGHLEIMAGGGVTQHNIRELVEYTGIREVHGSGKDWGMEWGVARDYVESEMVYKKENVFMGGEKVEIGERDKA